MAEWSLHELVSVLQVRVEDFLLRYGRWLVHQFPESRLLQAPATLKSTHEPKRHLRVRPERQQADHDNEANLQLPGYPCHVPRLRLPQARTEGARSARQLLD